MSETVEQSRTLMSGNFKGDLKLLTTWRDKKKVDVG